MTVKSSNWIMFLVAFAFFLVGRILTYAFKLEYSLPIDPTSVGGLLFLAGASLFLASLFFGRAVFIGMILVGLITSPALSFHSVFFTIFAGIGFALFAALGAFIGQTVSEDLQETEPARLLTSKVILMVIIGIVWCTAIGFFSSQIQEYNEHSIQVVKDVRDGKVDWVGGIALLAGANYTQLDVNRSTLFDPNRIVPN